MFLFENYSEKSLKDVIADNKNGINEQVNK